MENKKMVISFTFCLAVTFIFALYLSLQPFKSSNPIQKTKYVETVRIEEGDTLWDIARRYYTVEYKDVNSLLEEIKNSNNIGDTIYIGQHIIVPHYRKT